MRYTLNSNSWLKVLDMIPLRPTNLWYKHNTLADCSAEENKTRFQNELQCFLFSRKYVCQRNAENADDDNVVHACADVFGIIQFRDSDLPSLPGEKNTKDQQQTFVDIDSDDPVGLQWVSTQGVHLRKYNIEVVFILKSYKGASH